MLNLLKNSIFSKKKKKKNLQGQIKNELKWYATEPDQGQVNYTIADNMFWSLFVLTKSSLEATIYSGRTPNTHHNGCVTLQDLNYN